MKAARIDADPERLGDREASECDLDRGLPCRRGTDEHDRGGRDRLAYGLPDARIVGSPPEKHVRIEEQRAHELAPNAASRSAGSGASKSSAIRTDPSQPPGSRGVACSRSGTRRASGTPFFAIMISSPAAARSTSCDRLV